MTKLPNEEFRQMVLLLREKDFYESEKPREISWPEYNLSQIKYVHSHFQGLCYCQFSSPKTQCFTLGNTMYTKSD